MPEPLLYLKAFATAAVVSAMSVMMMAAVRRQASATWRNTACILAMSFGLVAGYRVLAVQWTWPPVSGLDRFLTIVVPLALGIELIVGTRRLPQWFVWLLRIGFAATIPRILLHGSIYLNDAETSAAPERAIATMAVCGAMSAGVWSLLARLSTRSPGVSIPLALCLSIQSAGIAIMLAGYIKGGAAALPLVAVIAATTITSTWFTRRAAQATGDIEPTNFDAQAMLGIAVVGLFSLLFIGHFFGRLSSGSAIAVLFAPLLCWTTELPMLRHRQPRLVGPLRLLLVAIPLAAVLVLAKRDFDRKMAPLLGTAPVSEERSTTPHLAAAAGCGFTCSKTRAKKAS